MNGSASLDGTAPRSTSASHAACERSMPSKATFAEPSASDAENWWSSSGQTVSARLTFAPIRK